MEIERRGRQVRCLSNRFETREADGELYIEGYFNVFNSPYELWEGATEIVKPGAFADCLSQDVRALVNHDSTLVLGRTKAGTLELKEDTRGLWGRIKINRDDADAMNLYALVQRGAPLALILNGRPLWIWATANTAGRSRRSTPCTR